MHSFPFVLEVRGPTKYHLKRAYFGTSTVVPYVVYGTVRTRTMRTTGIYYGYSYRLILAAFHGHTHSGMRVPVLRNEDSSCSRLYVRECNTSNTATTPNISDVCTAAAAAETARARGSVLLITYQVLRTTGIPA